MVEIRPLGELPDVPNDEGIIVYREEDVGLEKFPLCRMVDILGGRLAVELIASERVAQRAERTIQHGTAYPPEDAGRLGVSAAVLYAAGVPMRTVGSATLGISRLTYAKYLSKYANSINAKHPAAAIKRSFEIRNYTPILAVKRDYERLTQGEQRVVSRISTGMTLGETAADLYEEPYRDQKRIAVQALAKKAHHKLGVDSLPAMILVAQLIDDDLRLYDDRAA